VFERLFSSDRVPPILVELGQRFARRQLRLLHEALDASPAPPFHFSFQQMQQAGLDGPRFLFCLR